MFRKCCSLCSKLSFWNMNMRDARDTLPVCKCLNLISCDLSSTPIVVRHYSILSSLNSCCSSSCCTQYTGVITIHGVRNIVQIEFMQKDCSIWVDSSTVIRLSLLLPVWDRHSGWFGPHILIWHRFYDRGPSWHNPPI